MASVATSNITALARLITNNQGSSLNIGNQAMQCFRIASGQTAGDTAVLQDPNVPIIQSCVGPGSHNISGTGVTAVTVTLGAVIGTTITSTIGACDFWVLGPLPTS